MRSIYTFLFLALSLLTFAQQSKKYNSLFWEITGNGLSKPSYLYGTMHVSNKVAFHLSDSFFIAIKNVDVVGLETNPENWMEELYGEEKNKMDISKSLQQSSGGLYKSCFDLNIPDNRDLKEVLKYNPQIVNSLLYRKSESQDNFEENTYLDLFIMQAGRKLGKEIASLENYKESQQLVSKAYEAMYENEEDRLSYQKRSKLLKGSSYNEVIQDAYRMGNLDFMDSLSKIFFPSKNYQKYMLEVRNENMVHNMDSIMKLKSLFTGVGAAHLPGETGVINLLRLKGYTVKPVLQRSDIESVYKEEVEAIKYPVSLTTFTDPDSIFTVQVPGKMYEISKLKSNKYFLYPDMANGCFYMILCVQNNAALLGIKQSEFMKKIDSLLFENIPGKIVKKNAITLNNGWPAYEIENVTKRGDYQYYKIIFAPSMTIVAKVNGNGDYAKTPTAQKFIESLTFSDYKSKKFKEHNFSQYGVKIFMPERLQKQTNKTNSYSSFVNFTATGFDENNKQYTFIRSAYHDLNYLEEDTFELNILAESFCEEQEFKLKSKKIISKSKYPSLQFTASLNDKEFQGRIVLAQPFYYMLLSSAKDKNSDKFFNSLQLSNMSLTEPFESFTDTTLYFKVNTLQLTNKEENELSHYDRKKNKNNKKEPEPKAYYFSRTHYFKSASTSEIIKVDANRFSKYSNSENIDSFWVRRAKKYTYDGDLVLKEKKISKQKDWQEAEFLYTDTNTAQIIKVKVILKGELVYVIRSNSDSSNFHSPFVTQFYNTFTPLDTTFGTTLFESKARLFFTDLFSADKPTKLGAEKAIEENDVDFFPEDDTIIYNVIRSENFKSLSFKAKCNIISGLSESKSKDLIPRMKTLFDSYTDSTGIQVHILKTIADLKTEESSKAFMDLLINDTPPFQNSYEAEALFTAFNDSLELTKNLFPRLLELTRYSDYKDAVHKLLANAVYKKVIDKTYYQDYKPFLLKECKDELRRQFSSEKENNSYSDDYSLSAILNSSYLKNMLKNEEYSSFPETDLLRGNPTLFGMFVLLQPFSDEPHTQNLIKKIPGINDPYTKINIITYLEKKGISFPDSVVNEFSSSAKSRVYWYERLKEIDSLSLFDKKYLNQNDFARTLAFSSIEINEKEDTIKFMEKRPVCFKRQKGFAYFFKIKTKDDNNYKIYSAGIFPEDPKKMITENSVDLNKKEIEKGDSEKELIDEMLKTLRTKDRSRAGYTYDY